MLKTIYVDTTLELFVILQALKGLFNCIIFLETMHTNQVQNILYLRNFYSSLINGTIPTQFGNLTNLQWM